MSKIIHCQHCGIDYEVDEHDLGKQAKCDACGKEFNLGPNKEADKPGSPLIVEQELRELRLDLLDLRNYLKTERARTIYIKDFDISMGNIFWLAVKSVPALILASFFVGLCLLAISALFGGLFTF
ncbi:hypothetical protein P0Y35_08620 [Kiritimatiellaeota bacterium B1221]|nr:hypothetical protein [Kiritimatiellaeota bacterium B1221]